MLGQPNTQAKTFVQMNTQTTGAAGVVTIAAPTDGSQIIIDHVSATYLIAVATGALSITNIAGVADAATTLQWHISTAAPLVLDFTAMGGLRCVVNTAPVLTLVDGSTTKFLNVQFH